MSDKSFVIRKLNMIEVVQEAIRLYKDNFQLLIKISFILFLINMLSNTLNVLQYLLKDNTMILVYQIFSFVMIFPFLYFRIKFSIATYVCIATRYSEKDISIKVALNVGSKRFWKYVGVSIKYILILLVPIAGVYVSFFIKELAIKLTMFAIFAIPLVYFGTIYGFAPLMAALDKEKKQYFNISKKLVKGDIWKTIILTFVVVVAFSVPYILYVYVFNDYKTIPPVNMYIISTINNMMFLFVTPFTYSIYVTLFYKLKENKRI